MAIVHFSQCVCEPITSYKFEIESTFPNDITFDKIALIFPTISRSEIFRLILFKLYVRELKHTVKVVCDDLSLFLCLAHLFVSAVVRRSLLRTFLCKF